MMTSWLYSDNSWELGNEPNSLPHQLNFTLPAKKLGMVGIILELYFGWFDGTILGPEGAEASSSRISSFFQLADHWTGYQWSQEMLVEEGRYLPFFDRALFLIKFCCQRYLEKKLFEQSHLEMEKSVLPSNIWTLLWIVQVECDSN